MDKSSNWGSKYKHFSENICDIETMVIGLGDAAVEISEERAHF